MHVFHSVLQVWESVHIVSFMGHILIRSDMEVKVLDCGNRSRVFSCGLIGRFHSPVALSLLPVNTRAPL